MGKCMCEYLILLIGDTRLRMLWMIWMQYAGKVFFEKPYGQDCTVAAEIRGLDHEIHIQILVSLSCTICHELVTAAQKIASMTPFVIADVYDINHIGKIQDLISG